MNKPPEFAAPPRGPSEIATATKCRHCTKVFYGPRAVLKIGETPPARFYKYLAEINQHLATAHPKVFEKAYVLGTEFQGMLVLSNFDSADPEIIDQRNFYRWKVHQSTLQVKIDDTTIARKSAECVAKLMAEFDDGRPSIPPEILTAAIAAQLRELRDLLQEPGKYVVLDLTGGQTA